MPFIHKVPNCQMTIEIRIKCIWWVALVPSLLIFSPRGQKHINLTQNKRHLINLLQTFIEIKHANLLPNLIT
jgi:hypothetical protein